MAYSGTYTSSDLGNISVDLVGIILAVITQNAQIILFFVILGLTFLLIKKFFQGVNILGDFLLK